MDQPRDPPLVRCPISAPHGSKLNYDVTEPVACIDVIGIGRRSLLGVVNSLFGLQVLSHRNIQQDIRSVERAVEIEFWVY